MKIGKLVIRRSLCPEAELPWFHDFYKFKDGTWQLGFFGWLIYIKRKGK